MLKIQKTITSYTTNDDNILPQSGSELFCPEKVIQCVTKKAITTEYNMSSLKAVLTLKQHVQNHIIGQEKLVDRLLIALLADGHLLVEGAPGLAKTKAIKVLSDGIESNFHRIQFTPDLLPADLTGTEVYRPQDGSFVFQQGPLFHNLVLADEINRAPAKVQSALLEAMAERQITIGKVTYPLPELFMVMATQNPIEQEGTYPLPEAQLDRFLMHVSIDYPEAAAEKQILQLARVEARNVSRRVGCGGREDQPAALSSKRVARYSISTWLITWKSIYYSWYWRHAIPGPTVLTWRTGCCMAPVREPL